MAKTNWQDPKTEEIISPHISGLQEAVGKLEESVGIESVTETNIPLSEVYIADDDRCRIYQAPESKRNWLLSPTPVIKKNGTTITSGFQIDYGGGAIVFTNPILPSDTLTVDVAYTKKVESKSLSTNDYTDEEKNKNQLNADNISSLGNEFLELKYSELSSVAANVDDEGIYKIVEWRRRDNTLYAKSELIGTYPYGQIKIDYYNDTGNSIIKSVPWNVGYDDNGFPYIREVM